LEISEKILKIFFTKTKNFSQKKFRRFFLSTERLRKFSLLHDFFHKSTRKGIFDKKFFLIIFFLLIYQNTSQTNFQKKNKAKKIFYRLSKRACKLNYIIIFPQDILLISLSYNKPSQNGSLQRNYHKESHHH